MAPDPIPPDPTPPDPTQDGPLAELRKVNKVYGNGVPTHVLHDIDLVLRPGEFVAIQGASGSGKSTLLNLVGLLDTPTSGEIYVAGRLASKMGEDDRARMRREHIGFIFQFHYLLPEFDVLENALMPCRIKGTEAEEANRDRVLEMLDEVGLSHRLHHRPSEISGGEQQRVAVVRSLANDPALVLADEPTGNLDTKSGRAVFELMRRLNRETGTAFLLVSHDEALIQEADRVLELVDGWMK